MKDLDFYLEELAKKRTSIKDEDELRNPKGKREDWLDEEPEEDDELNDFSDDEDENDKPKSRLEKIIDILAEIDPEVRRTDPWLKELAEKITKLFEK